MSQALVQDPGFGIVEEAEDLPLVHDVVDNPRVTKVSSFRQILNIRARDSAAGDRCAST